MAAGVAGSNVNSAGRPADYAVGRPQGRCAVTGEPIEVGRPYFAALRETEAGFERLEFTPAAWADWPAEQKGGLLAHWRGVMPSPQEGKRKLLVDDGILAELFRRLEGVVEPEKLAFRFMLGLILMRKKKLVFEGSSHDAAGREVWRMRFRKEEQSHDLIDPKLDESQLDEVGRQVGQILNGGIDEEQLTGEGA